MKHRLKGLLALVLSLTMVFALATNAWATVRIGNEFLSDNGASISDGTNGTATLNISTENGVEVYTLTLNNFTMVDNSHYEAISSDQDLTLNLIGGNEITASYGSGAVAVSVTGKLAIEGTGSLTASGTKDGIAANGNLTITDATVTATGGDYCDGIYAGENITITNATVTATGDEAGIYSKKTITITGGTVTAEGDTHGLSASNVNIEGGTVTATGDEGCGIYTKKGNVTISGGTVKATGKMYGIFADKGNSSGGMNVTISGGSVEAYATNDTGSIGIYAPGYYGKIAISGANTKVDVGCVTGLAAEIVNIAGGSTVSIEAENANNENAIDSGELNMSGDYQWSTDGINFNNSSTTVLRQDDAKGTAKLYIKPITYTVTFNANGHGTDPSAQSSIAAGGKVSEPVAPSANGWTFGGWYKDAACSNAYDFSSAVHSSFTLYAKWTENTPVTYTVTYANGGGTGTGPTQSPTAAGSTFTLAQNPYTRTGYKFTGWNDGTTTYAAGDTYTMPANDVILTAQWTENSTGGPGAQQPSYNFPIYIPPVEEKPIESPNTFDGGIASAVVVTILSATGGAWLAKKKD